MPAAAAVVLVLAGCTSGEATYSQTADGTGVAVARRATGGASENLGSVIPVPPGAITINYAHPQTITLAAGASRAFDLDVGGSGYMHPLQLGDGSTPGVVRIDQTGGTRFGEQLTGTITGVTPGTVILQADSEDMEVSFHFVLTVRVVLAH